MDPEGSTPGTHHSTHSTRMISLLSPQIQYAVDQEGSTPGTDRSTRGYLGRGRRRDDPRAGQLA